MVVSRTVIPLSKVARGRPASIARTVLGQSAMALTGDEGLRGANAPAGGSDGGCAPPDAANLPPEVWAKVKDHPCYSDSAHHYFARIHLPVAPACNLQCNYCNRKFDCANESRPGVTSERLTPAEAADKVVTVAARMPELAVVGIAGPGDALADWRKTFETFDLVQARLPKLKLCLSTNGLALPDHIDEIKARVIDHVTITINMVDPAIGEQIYAWAYHQGRRWHGREASQLLHERQMEGLAKLVEAGILVKVNSVLIPGINDRHLKAVHEAITARGAFLHNVMPLISDPAHGTKFGLDGQREPTPAELEAAQADLGGGARLMKHCRQCRADAVGLLDQTHHSDEIEATGKPLPAIEEISRRQQVYREVVERERADRADAAERTAAALVHLLPGESYRVAVTTRGGGRVNEHFGRVNTFQIYEVARSGVRFVGLRRLDRYCGPSEGKDDRLEVAIKALTGVDAIVTAKVGDCPRERLAEAGLMVVDTEAREYIEPAAATAALTVRRSRSAPATTAATA